MKCTDVYLHICDNLDQRLETRRCREIRQHLRVCRDCRAYLASLKRTVSLYRSVPSPRLPKAAHDRLIRVLHAHGCFPVPVTRPGRGKPGRSRK
jgi:anti-sigma factor RsiW